MKTALLSIIEIVFTYLTFRSLVMFGFLVRMQVGLIYVFPQVTIGRVLYYLIIFLGTFGIYKLNQKIFTTTPKFLAWLLPLLAFIWGII